MDALAYNYMVLSWFAQRLKVSFGAARTSLLGRERRVDYLASERSLTLS